MHGPAGAHSDRNLALAARRRGSEGGNLVEDGPTVMTDACGSKGV